jgi:ParB family transcriptional regulator, chromosome partitioning protein
MMDVELGQLEMRYAELRRRNAHKERQLIASLAERGQQVPVVVVAAAEAGRYVLLDGYKRVRALKELRLDTVRATSWDLAELEAVLLERLMRTSEAEGALEQGWLLEELNERFALSYEELARRFDRSLSWVSRRLALVRELPREVQQCVRSGALPAHAAMKYLVPLARAKRADCLRLVAALGTQRPSTRDVGELYAAWACGNAQTRELVVTQPAVVLRAKHETRASEPAEKTPSTKLLDDFGILIGVSRRARQRLAQGALASLLSTEQLQAQQVAQQARWQCDALFRAAAALLETAPTVAPAAPSVMSASETSCPNLEVTDAR